MIRYDDALALILARTPPEDREGELVSLDDAEGRVTAREVRSPEALPPFPNSAMDGFALATGGSPVPSGTRLAVAGSVAAGDAPLEAAAASGRAWEIMTGGPMPAGLDAVIPVERVRREEGREGGHVVLEARVEPGDNVRPAGKDFAEGDPILGPGRSIGAGELMALAALGVARVPVLPRLRGAIFSTGPELVDDPELPLEPGRIRNSNGPYLRRVLTDQGVQVVAAATLGDDTGPFVEALGSALEAGVDLVVSTGAVSMGRHDFVPAALEQVGARILFHRAAIRPGKPVLAATLPGEGLYFGLPGNPMSAATGYRFFVLPWLRAAWGLAPETPWRLPLTEAVSKRPELRYFTRAEVAATPEGPPGVRVLPGQQSFRIAPFLAAQGWAVLPEGTDEVRAGTLVDVYGLHGPRLEPLAPATGR